MESVPFSMPFNVSNILQFQVVAWQLGLEVLVRMLTHKLVGSRWRCGAAAVITLVHISRTS